MNDYFIKPLYDRYKAGTLDLDTLQENVRAEVQKLIDKENV